MDYDEDIGAILQSANSKYRILNNKSSSSSLLNNSGWSIEQIAEKMMNGITVKTRSKSFKKYEDCFTGSEGLSWIMSNEITDSKERALEIGSILLYNGYISCIQGSEFEDSAELFYNFNKDVIESSSNSVDPKREDVHDETLLDQSKIKEILEKSGDENIFHSSDEEISYNEEKQIKGMSFLKMIMHLTECHKLDVELAREMILTYDLFVSSKDFMFILQSRYCTILPTNISEEKQMSWNKEKAPLIKEKVLEIVKIWIENQSSENLESNSWFHKSILSWMNRIGPKKNRKNSSPEIGNETNPVNAPVFNSTGLLDSSSNTNATASVVTTENHQKLVGEIQTMLREGKKKATLDSQPKMLRPKTSPIKTVTDIPPLELARQITMMGFLIYKNIRPEELLNKRWQHETHKNSFSPNVTNFVRYFNYFSLWASTVVLSGKKSKNRASFIEYMIQLAIHCKDLNNYCGVMQIVSGLRITAVRRLKKSWKSVSSSSIQQWEELQSVVSTDQNYANMRNLLRDCKLPALPYLGIWLSDMFFAVDGNADFLSENPHIINLKKLRLVTGILENILNFQTVEYNFVHSSTIQKFIFEVQVKDEAQLENVSLFLEPKN